MNINYTNSKKFNETFKYLNFHDSEIRNIKIDDNGLFLIIEYYNWEERNTNNNKPWFALQIKVKRVFHFEIYGPNPDIFLLSLDRVVYDVHQKENEKYLEIVNDEENYIDLMFHTLCMVDNGISYNGFIKIFGANCSIEIIEINIE